MKPAPENRTSPLHILAPELKVAQVGLPMFLTWEFLQSPFYSDTFTDTWARLLYNRVHCTGGDMIILLGAFWLVSLVWGRSWMAQAAAVPVVLFVASGFFYTIFSEYRNVYVAHSWAYSSWMPTIAGIGLVPVVQWLAIPPSIILILKGKFRYISKEANRG